MYVPERLSRLGQTAFLLLALTLAFQAMLPAGPQLAGLAFVGQQGIPIGRDPRAIAHDPSSNVAVIAIKHTKSVSIIDLVSGHLLANVPLERAVDRIVVDPVLGRAYLGIDSGSLIALSLTTGELSPVWDLGYKIKGLAVMPGGHELLVADATGRRLVRLDTNDGTELQSISIGEKPESLTLDDTGTNAIVGTRHGARFIELSSSLETSLELVKGIQGVAWWEGGGVAIGAARDDAFYLLDPRLGSVLGKIPVGFSTEDLVVNESRRQLYATVRGHNSIAVIDLDERALAGFYLLPGRPRGMALTAMAEELLVTLSSTDQLLRLDISRAPLSTALYTGTKLHEIAIDETSNEALIIGSAKELLLVQLKDFSTQRMALSSKPKAVAIDSVRRLALIGEHGESESLRRFDLDSRQFLSPPLPLQGGAKSIVIDTSRGLAIVRSHKREELHVVDLDAWNVSESFAFEGKLRDAAIDIPAGRAIVIHEIDKEVSELVAIDMTSLSITTRVPIESGARAVEVDGELRIAVITLEKSDALQQVDLETEEVSFIPFARRPKALALHSEKHLAVVASESEDQLGIVDLQTGEATTHYVALKKPRRVAVSAKLNAALVLSDGGRRLHLVPLPEASTEKDTLAPVVSPPADLTIEATAIETPVLLGAATAIDETDGPVGAAADRAGPFALGTHIVTWSAQDKAGNLGMAEQVVVVRDTTLPELTVPADIERTADEATPIDIGVAVATDVFEPVEVSHDAPAAFSPGTTLVSWTARDANDNVTTVIQRVTLRSSDTSAPFVGRPPDLVAEATGVLTAVTLGPGIAFDDTDGILVATPDPIGPFPLGVHTVTWSATDRAGNVGTAKQMVTVVDTTPPTLTVPPDLRVVSETPKTVDIGEATATDLVSVVSVTNDAPDLFPLGTTIVNWTATDAAGNIALAEQAVSLTSGGVDVAIATPLPDAHVEASKVLVEGTHTGPHHTGVTVNGIPAIVDGNQFYALVRLVDGANDIQVTATTFSGASSSKTVTVTRVRASVFAVDVLPAVGIPPLGVEILVEPLGLLPVKSVSVDFDGDGTVDTSVDQLGLPIERTYDEPGTHILEIRVTDTADQEFVFLRPVHVVPLVDFHNMILELWTGVSENLAAGRIDEALAWFDPSVHEHYRATLTARAAQLGEMFQPPPPIHPIRVGRRSAEYVLLLSHDGVEHAVFVYFMKSDDGIWRLEAL